jgi:hypothetical protein
MPEHHQLSDSRRRPGGSARLGRWCSVGVALLTLVTPAAVNGRALSEYDVKAAFLLNFAKFVEWPAASLADSNAPIVIGIVGDDPFSEILPQLVVGQTTRGRRLAIRHYDADGDFADCHLLFLSRSVAAQTGDILRRLQSRPVLTVSEKDDFVRQGGIIGFALVDKSVRFDINAKAAEQVKIVISSKLLAVARSVVK